MKSGNRSELRMILKIRTLQLYTAIAVLDTQEVRYFLRVYFLVAEIV